MHEAQQLILLVKKEESLWNIYSESFLNKILKNEAWDRIAREVKPEWHQFTLEDREKTIADLKKRWYNIKDYYKREKLIKHKHYSKRKSGYVLRRKYIFYDLLGFLDPVLGLKSISCRAGTEEAQARIAPSCITDKSFRSPGDEESTQIPCESYDDTADYTIKQSPQSGQDSTDYDIAHTPPLMQDNYEPFMTVIPLPRKDAPVKQMQRAQPSQNITDYLSNNPSVAFLLSFAQEMEEMTPYQRIEFKSGVLHLLKVIKYPTEMKIQIT